MFVGAGFPRPNDKISSNIDNHKHNGRRDGKGRGNRAPTILIIIMHCHITGVSCHSLGRFANRPYTTSFNLASKCINSHHLNFYHKKQKPTELRMLFSRGAAGLLNLLYAIGAKISSKIASITPYRYV
jgi:hypothetical protein